MFLIIEDNWSISRIDIIDEVDHKFFRIYKKNNDYFIVLKDGVYFDDNKKSKKLIKRYYGLNLQNYYYKINLFVYPNNKGIDKFVLYENKNITISDKADSDIIIKDPYLKDKYVSISNGFIKTNTKVSLNSKPYNNQPLKQKDLIEILGLKIIYFDKYLYINSFLNKVNLNKASINEHIVQYNIQDSINNYYIPEEVYPLEIEELKPFNKSNKSISQQLYKSISPNIVMFLSLASLSLLNYYNALLDEKPFIQRLPYLIMPIGMFISAIVLPIIFYFIDKHNDKKQTNKEIEEYLSYLDNYEKEIEDRIYDYTKRSNSHYFNILDDIDKMFYAGKSSDDYLKLSIGKIKINKQFKYSKTNILEIDNRLESIKKRLSIIDNIPLFIDLNIHKNITIVSKKNKKKYFFYKLLLELSYKHHYEDINIAIYTKDFSIFDELYNLPHLFINDKRLSLNSYTDLQNLDQMHLKKPVILFLFDESEYRFTNPNINIIYFSDSIKKIYKDFQAIIKYANNTGILFHKDRIVFDYLEQKIDFYKYFNLLGRFNKLTNNKKIFSFKDIFLDYDIYKNYQNNNNIDLKASFAYDNNEIIEIDLHESKQGPHGLIGGSTGSGKSELIISFLLSMCIRYSPKYLNIVLIDYKGGGINESLSYNGQSIPHVVAHVSNLENNIFERLIIYLKNECVERQKLFKELSNNRNLSIMNIDDYIQNSIDNTFKNIAHLLIVVDEFAQLKKENPELIKELISISRIGRSLGVHLILATQKPSGNIDDEIWSNSRFKIALKLFEEKDSIDIIKSKDAAYLKSAGSFFMRIDESIIYGNSVYSKKDIDNNDPYEVALLNNTLESIKEYKSSNQISNSEASYYCKEIIDVCKKLNITKDEYIFKAPIAKKREEYNIENYFVFGQIDDYINCNYDVLKYSLNQDILIYSERKKEINSIINTLSDNSRNTIIIGNKQYKGKCISDSLLYDQYEDISFLFNKLISDNLEVTLIIDDLNSFLTYKDTYLNDLYILLQRSANLLFNIICLTNYSQLSFKIINSFKNRLIIESSDMNNTNYIFSTRSRYKGSSLFFKEEPISFIPNMLEKLNEEESIFDNIIKQIPDNIERKIDNNSFIGYEFDSREEVFLDEELLICSYDRKLLDLYKDYNVKYTIKKYDHSINNDNYRNILWLGSGIHSQRLFMCSKRNEFTSKQGLLIQDGIQKELRIFNYV